MSPSSGKVIEDTVIEIKEGDKLIASDSSYSSEPLVKELNLSAVDVVEALRQGLVELPERASMGCLSNLFCRLLDTLNMYDESVKRNAIAVDSLTEEKSSDKELQKIAYKYELTMNQVVAYMDMCDQVNGGMEGTGVIAVPFWFYEQYTKLQEQNKALIEQTDNLMQTLGKVEEGMKSGSIEGLGLELPKRTNIITGATTPYIAGETGPRRGHEHLDKDNIYIPNLRK